MHRALLQAGVGVAAVRLVGMAAGFALTVVLARVLGPKGVGSYGYTMMLLTLAAVPVNNGWATLLLRTTARARGGRNWQDGTANWGEVVGLLRWGLWLALGLTVLELSLGLLILGPSGQGVLSFGALALLAGILLFDQLSGLRLAVLRGLDHPVWGQMPEMLLRPLLILGFFLLLTALHPDTPRLFDAFLALIGAAAVAALIGWLILWHKAPNVLRCAAPEPFMPVWTRSAALLAGNAGLVMLNAQIDFVMLGLLGTPEDLGHYRVAMQIGLLSGFVYTALNMIAMQRLAYLFASGSQDELQRSATFLARLAFLGALPLPLIFGFWGESILLALFGIGFEAALPPLMWLLGVQVLSAGVGFAHATLVMAGREGRILPLTALCVVINAGLCLLLIPRLGLEGASIASFIALGTWNILLLVNALVLRGVDSSIFGILLWTVRK